jgi:thymidylate synthase
MKNYLLGMQDILTNGEYHPSRTGIGTYSVFGRQLRFDLTEGFPLVTSKKTFIKGIIKELLWFLKGSSNVQELIDDGVHIWDAWMVTDELINNPPERIARMIEIISSGDPMQKKIIKEEMLAIKGTIGPLYGPMMRSAPGGNDARASMALNGPVSMFDIIAKHAPDKIAAIKILYGDDEQAVNAAILQEYGNTVDQVQQLILSLKENPHSRRHLISCWFPEFLPDERLTPEENVMCGRQALAPCHVLQQYYVSLPKEPGGKKRLSLMMTQRSSDYFLGIPFNIASYSLLLMMIAQVVDMEPFEFIWSSGDTHIYENTVDQCKLQLSREPRVLPTMKINPDVKSLYDFKFEDFTLEGYDPHPAIKATVAK